MGRTLGGLLSVVVGAIVIMATAVAPAAAAKHAPRHKVTKITHAAKTSNVIKLTKLAQLGHSVFWECPSSSTALLVGVNRTVLHPGQVLNMNFIAKNTGATGCNYVAPYASGAPGTVSTTLQVGPCGSMGFEVMGAKHRNVWPGVVAFNCPALGFAELQPGASVSGLGTWAQTLPNSSKRIPVGNYTLIIDGHFSFPLTIAPN